MTEVEIPPFLYDAAGMRGVDAWAIERRGVPGLDLMEAAGRALADVVAEVAPGSGPVRVVVGKGNNGGDGFVAARLLGRLGFEVEVLSVWDAGLLAGDAAANRDRYEGPVRRVPPDEWDDALAGSSVVVDAIFGTGFAGAPEAEAAAAIDAVNSCGAIVVAADIASGVDASTGEAASVAVEADLTVAFHAAKLGHWIAPGKWHAGELRVAEIGIPEPAEEDEIPAPAAVLIAPELLDPPPGRGPDSTKFSSGEVVVVGGSTGLTGAVCMAAEAATRAGAGYATVAVPADLQVIFEVKLTEVMSKGFAGAEGRLAAADAASVASACERAGAVVVGSGLGRDPDSEALVRELLASIAAPVPVVLDADGINAYAGRAAELSGREGVLILTPHEGELGRLLDLPAEEVAARRLTAVREAARLTGAIVLLKGDDTLVAAGERLAIATGDSPGLATAGSGDVLAGLIAALLARGMEPFEAACLAACVHQEAGRIAAGWNGSPDTVIATDVIAALPQALVPSPGDAAEHDHEHVHGPGCDHDH